MLLFLSLSFGKELSEELESLKERYAAISRENSDLTMALVLIQVSPTFTFIFEIAFGQTRIYLCNRRKWPSLARKS